ncbi:MAG: PP_RS20740 family protein [Planctomycetales bacterium]
MKKRLVPPIPKEAAGGLVDQAIPGIVPTAPRAKIDLSDPWYRPAKHYIRREQWNRSILSLLNKLPELTDGEIRVLRYVGLPGQHHLDLLGMHGICNAKSIRVNYLGFRIGDGAPTQTTPLDQLLVLSNVKFHTPDSIVVHDSVENIGSTNTPAHLTFRDRGPFDVINLDVCGGILHGSCASLLNSIKAILLLQNSRTEPWLLFLTTMAKYEFIGAEVLSDFFKTIKDNCDSFARFKNHLTTACEKFCFDLDPSLDNPRSLGAPAFLRLFTLAFGKWLLVNLAKNSPRAVATLQSAYQFRNTGRTSPEMLSLSYLVKPVTAGGSDPTKLTRSSAALGTGDSDDEDYAVKLVAPSVEEMRDLDEVWDDNPELMQAIIDECEELLRMIGADDAGIQEWRKSHGIKAKAPNGV